MQHPKHPVYSRATILSSWFVLPLLLAPEYNLLYFTGEKVLCQRAQLSYLDFLDIQATPVSCNSGEDECCWFRSQGYRNRSSTSDHCRPVAKEVRRGR